jgi:hypothetical protein
MCLSLASWRIGAIDSLRRSPTRNSHAIHRLACALCNRGSGIRLASGFTQELHMVHLRGESMVAATTSAEEVEKMFRNELLLGEVGRRGETRGKTSTESLVNDRASKDSTPRSGPVGRLHGHGRMINLPSIAKSSPCREQRRTRISTRISDSRGRPDRRVMNLRTSIPRRPNRCSE